MCDGVATDSMNSKAGGWRRGQGEWRRGRVGAWRRIELAGGGVLPLPTTPPSPPHAPAPPHPPAPPSPARRVRAVVSSESCDSERVRGVRRGGVAWLSLRTLCGLLSLAPAPPCMPEGLAEMHTSHPCVRGRPTRGAGGPQARRAWRGGAGDSDRGRGARGADACARVDTAHLLRERGGGAQVRGARDEGVLGAGAGC